MMLMSRTPARAIERARDWCRGERSTSTSVRICLRFSLATPKLLFLVDDHEPEVTDHDILCRSRCVPMTMSTLPSASFAYLVLLGTVRNRVAEHLDLDREGRQTLINESLVVLLRKDCRDEHRDLRAVHDGFEGGAQGDLGLTYPASPQMRCCPMGGPISCLTVSNGPGPGHRFGNGNAASSSRCHCAAPEGAPVDDLAGGVEIEELGRQLRGCPGNAPWPPVASLPACWRWAPRPWVPT